MSAFSLGDEIAAALELEKSRFLVRNRDRCGYLLVRLVEDEQRIVLTASYTLGAARNWQRAETTVPRAELMVEAGPAPRLERAFARLEEAIGASRMAQLFAPLSVARRMAAGRR